MDKKDQTLNIKVYGLKVKSAVQTQWRPLMVPQVNVTGRPTLILSTNVCITICHLIHNNNEQQFKSPFEPLMEAITSDYLLIDKYIQTR